jgi:hypothetical protein
MACSMSQHRRGRRLNGFTVRCLLMICGSPTSSTIGYPSAQKGSHMKYKVALTQSEEGYGSTVRSSTPSCVVPRYEK